MSTTARDQKGVTWVVGAGGLLGRHVVARLKHTDHRVMTKVVPWTDPARARQSLRAGLNDLISQADGGPWNIAWCAGAGVVATPAEVLAEEQATFTDFLDDLRRLPAGAEQGAFCLASSAGGVFAGSASPPFTENADPRPLAPYGHLKLAMETELTGLARDTEMPALIGRISNLYGPGQNMRKPQGLVSHLCKAHFTGQQLSIYVSLDTIRDYLLVGDCADMVVAGLDGLRHETHQRRDPTVVKVLASGRGTTVGALIAECRRVFRRQPRIVLGSSPTPGLQSTDLRLRSVTWRELDRYARTPLAAGISATAEDIKQRACRVMS